MPGRRTKPDLIALIVRMAHANTSWGYTRIHDGMRHLGHLIGRNTIRRVLQDHGIEAAPERSKRMPWKTFLQSLWEGFAAADFFTVEVVTIGGLVRFHVLFIMRLRWCLKSVPSSLSVARLTIPRWTRTEFLAA